MDVICIAINDFMLLLLKGGKNIARCSVNPCIFNRAMNLTHHSTADVLHSHFSTLTFRLRLKGMLSLNVTEFPYKGFKFIVLFHEGVLGENYVFVRIVKY